MYKKITRFCGLFFHIFAYRASKFFPLATGSFFVVPTPKGWVKVRASPSPLPPPCEAGGRAWPRSGQAENNNKGKKEQQQYI